MVAVVTVLVSSIFLFVLVMFPVWTFVECVRSNTLSRRAKIAWGIAIGVTWTLGAVFYSIFGTNKRGLRVSSGVVVLISVLAIGFGLTARGRLDELFRETQFQLDQADLTAIESTEQSELREAVQGLLINVQDPLAEDGTPPQTVVALMSLLQGYLIDGQLARWEYKEWMKLYDTRWDFDLEGFRGPR